MGVFDGKFLFVVDLIPGLVFACFLGEAPVLGILTHSLRQTRTLFISGDHRRFKFWTSCTTIYPIHMDTGDKLR